MQEWNSGTGQDKEKTDLEDRLAAYYGPELREQPLPQSEWLRLQAHLGSRRSVKRVYLRRILRHQNTRSKRIPVYIQDAFSHMLREAHMQHSSPILQCSFKPTVRVPEANTSFLGKRTIQLILPSNAVDAMERPMLDVLLAAGLARYFFARRLENRLPGLLLTGVVAITCAMLILWVVYKYSPLPFLIALLLCVAVMGLVSVQRGRIVFRADELMVRWLGRSRVCRGLHLLAVYSGKRRRVLWGEPSLGERIGRICGTRVEVEDERLTLVR